MFIGISEYNISIFFRKVFVDNIEIIIHYKVMFTHGDHSPDTVEFPDISPRLFALLLMLHYPRQAHIIRLDRSTMYVCM